MNEFPIPANCSMRMFGALGVFTEEGTMPMNGCGHQYGTPDVCTQNGVKMETCRPGHSNSALTNVAA